jgi:hypothetical protein
MLVGVVVVPILAVLVGVGLWKRGKRHAGWAFVTLGSTPAVVLLILGHVRPLVGLVAILGLVGGIVADEHGKRAWGLLGISIGVFALSAAAIYT